MRAPYCAPRDPVFLAALALYTIGRFVLRPTCDSAWLDAYWNDLLLAGIVVPPVTWARQHIGVRPDGGPPDGHEVVLPIVVVAAVFELAVPLLHPTSLAGYADPYDLAAYATGALVALIAWRGRRSTVTSR